MRDSKVWIASDRLFVLLKGILSAFAISQDKSQSDVYPRIVGVQKERLVRSIRGECQSPLRSLPAQVYAQRRHERQKAIGLGITGVERDGLL